MKPVRKVLAYIVRRGNMGDQLLVFTHRDYPEAGIQVPAGTVDEGEAVEAALFREVREETGFSDFTLVRKLGCYEYFNAATGVKNEPHVFHLAPDIHLPERWTWVETDGGRASEDEGYVFQFFWADLSSGVDLAGNQGDYLGALLAR